MSLDDEFASGRKPKGDPVALIGLLVLTSAFLLFLWPSPQRPAPGPAAAETPPAPAGDAWTGQGPDPARRVLTLRSPYLEVPLDTAGGVIREVRLVCYTASAVDGDFLYLLQGTTRSPPPLWVRPSGSEAPWDPKGALGFSVVRSDAHSALLERTVRTREGATLLLRKSVSLDPGRPVLTGEVRVRNAGDKIAHVRLDVVGVSGLRQEPPDPRSLFAILAPKRRPGAPPESRDTGSLVKKPLIEDQAPISYLGLQNRYFAAVFIPGSLAQPGETGAVEKGRVQVEGEGPVAVVTLPPTDLEPGADYAFPFALFAGPKREAEAVPGLQGMFRLGWPEPISRLCLTVLTLFEALTGNWGVAILLLSVTIRLLLFPLTYWSQRSALRMQGLQPQVQELKERFKNNPKRLNQETMALYKKHGANPVSGCLPVLFQFPVLIALYKSLWSSIELRHASFLFIRDLAEPDRFLPNLFGGFDLNLIPLLMTGASFAQARMTPKSPDPQAAQQQQMMAYMPIIFLVFFYGMPSGLTFYWLLVTLFAMGEQTLVKRLLKRVPRAAD